MLHIETLINEYIEIQNEEEALKARKDAKKAEIINQLNLLGVKSAETNDGKKATLALRETFKYTDELAMIKYLKDNGYSNYVVEKVDSTALNKQLKTKTILSESLSGMYTKTISEALTVK